MGKRKPREKRTAATTSSNAPPADVNSDTDSITSDATHMSIEDDEGICGDGPIIGDDDAEEARNKFETHLAENIDNATHKSSSVRLGALNNLLALLSRHILPDIVIKWRVSLCDVVERSVKKASTVEGAAAVRLLALTTVQLGGDMADECAKLVQLLRVIVTDDGVDLQFRGNYCAPTLALCTYIAIDDLDMLTDSIASLRTMWTSIKAGNVVPEMGDPFEAAVRAYGLLMGRLPNRALTQALNTDIPKLTAYLQSNQVQIRISAGETLALLYELASDMYRDDEWRPSSHQQIVERLEALQNDSLKYHAKRDRRVQRASFRDIAHYIKTREFSPVVYKFGVGEKLNLRDWASKLCYDTHCLVLKSAMNAHLQKNRLLRDMFDLGAPMVGGGTKEMFGDRSDRLAIHAAADKVRTQHRGKQRGKRLASFTDQ